MMIFLAIRFSLLVALDYTEFILHLIRTVFAACLILLFKEQIGYRGVLEEIS